MEHLCLSKPEADVASSTCVGKVGINNVGSESEMETMASINYMRFCTVTAHITKGVKIHLIGLCNFPNNGIQRLGRLGS